MVTKIGTVRIIAGKWRGMKLQVLESVGLRPTSNRIRETLFNWLQNHIVGARCLDLFSGTGALAFESLSRGAIEVFMVESDVILIDQLKKQSQQLQAKSHIILDDGLNWVEQNVKKFDIIFLDPPFGFNYIEKSCNLILKKNILTDNGLVYIETEKSLKLPEGWKIEKQTQTAKVCATLISKEKLR